MSQKDRVIPNRVSLCSCSADALKNGNCHVLDLGVIYEKLPIYTENNPCEKTQTDRVINGECVTTYDDPPYGKILPYQRACAKMIIYENARIYDKKINYKKRTLYFSRQRKDLPELNCNNPIYCPPENEKYTCCKKYQVGGPYLNCSVDESNCSLECNELFKPQNLKYGLSNCMLSVGGKNVLLAGYAENYGNTVSVGDGTTRLIWWFAETQAFQKLEKTIVDRNPYDDIPWFPTMTIYVHFQLEWKPIRCFNRGGMPAPPCYGKGKINIWNGRCGTSHTMGLVDDFERESSVRIKAAIGYSVGGCGYSAEKACEKAYDVSDVLKPFGKWII